jgi:hypothetical protein
MGHDLTVMSIGCVGHVAQASVLCCGSSFHLVGEATQPVADTTNGNIRTPFTRSTVPVHASVPRSSFRRQVLSIQRLSGEPKIAASIVQAIPVDVIDVPLVTVAQPEQFAMEIHGSRLAIHAHHSDRVVSIGSPSPLGYPVCIIGVDKRVSRDAASEGYADSGRIRAHRSLPFGVGGRVVSAAPSPLCCSASYHGVA